MKQKLSWVLEGFFLIVILGFSILIYAPKQSENILHIRLIQVTGRNKEKAIEQDSLIFVKTFTGNEEPMNNTLVSFQADRFGESVILTHMFVKSEVRNQETFYITQAPESSYYDTYETKHEDLIGSYLFHMPYMGKVYEFLQSSYGKIIYAGIAVFCIVSTLYMQFKMMRRDHIQKKAKERIDEEPSIEALHETTAPKEAEPLVSELSEDGVAIDIQVNQLERKILENIKEGNTKEDKIPQYRIAGIQEALRADNKAAVDNPGFMENPDSLPFKAQNHTASEGMIKELDKLLKEEIEYEKYVKKVRNTKKDENSESDDEELALYIPTDQAIVEHTYSEKDIQTFTDSQLQDVSMTVDADIEEDSFDEADMSDMDEEESEKQLKESKGNVLEHPVFDTPKHIVPQVVVYPQDTPEDVKGLYNSDASKFEKKIPSVEEPYIQVTGILEPVMSSIQETDNDVYKHAARSGESIKKEPSAGFEIIHEKAESELELMHSKAKHCVKASAADSVHITEPLETSLHEKKETTGETDSELMIEVRREVQELLHGRKIPEEDDENWDYPDFNRKYAVKNKTNESVEDTAANAQKEQSTAYPAFEKKREHDEDIVLKDLKFDCSGRFAILHGKVINHLSVPIRYIKAEIELYDDFHNVVNIMKWYLCGREYLKPGETRDFTYTAYEIYGVYDYHIRILSCKQN